LSRPDYVEVVRQQFNGRAGLNSLRVAAELGWSLSVVDRAIRELIKKGVLVASGGGYRLADTPTNQKQVSREERVALAVFVGRAEVTHVELRKTLGWPKVKALETIAKLEKRGKIELVPSRPLPRRWRFLKQKPSEAQPVGKAMPRSQRASPSKSSQTPYKHAGRATTPERRNKRKQPTGVAPKAATRSLSKHTTDAPAPEVDSAADKWALPADWRRPPTSGTDPVRGLIPTRLRKKLGW
jgi:hypothetical protein